MNAPITEDDLHAYADGQLAPEQLMQVEAWLTTHSEHRAQIEQWRAQSMKLHRAFDRVLDEPVPARLLPAGNEPRWMDARKIAAIGWLMLGTAVGYLVHGEIQTVQAPAQLRAIASLPRQAAIAHAVYVPEVRHPVEVGADQEAHLVIWLSRRLGAPLKPPTLSDAGYQLVGGRLLPGDKGEVAQFMYENATNNRLTLYVRPDAPGSEDTAFRYANENGIDVFYWVDGPFGYALSGNTGRDDMLRLATLVYKQRPK